MAEFGGDFMNTVANNDADIIKWIKMMIVMFEDPRYKKLTSSPYWGKWRHSTCV